MTTMTLATLNTATRTFSLGDQRAFAALSGDNNPIHLDPLEARRSLFGAPVVHGVHALLWGVDHALASESLGAEDPASGVQDVRGAQDHNVVRLAIASLRATFIKPMRVGEAVDLSIKGGPSDYTLHWTRSADQASLAKVRLHLMPASELDALPWPSPDAPTSRALSDAMFDPASNPSGEIPLHLPREAARRMFPRACACLIPSDVATLLAATRLVGTECPGLYSVFSEIDIRRSISPGGPLTSMDYRVESFDDRFQRVQIGVAAPSLTGTLAAFLRPPPQHQAAFADIKRCVEPGEFDGQRALVIGGSRGLGEVAAKLLAAGGADVVISYHQGKADAQAVVDDICAEGGRASCLQLDALALPPPHSTRESLTADAEPAPTHLYYFASPFIFAATKGRFSPDLFGRFCDYYVLGFLRIVNHFAALGLRNVFHPSTSALDELPLHMGEYAAAKGASEVVGQFIEKATRGMVVHQPRLPRMATDQTASLVPIPSEDPAPILLAELRRFKSLGSVST